MAVENVTGIEGQQSTFIPYTDLSFDIHNTDSSVLKLVFWIRPKWRECSQELKIVKFTEGITNTLLKVARHRPDVPLHEADNDAILMRAYGNRTEIIIDRDREAVSHRLLADRGMAPPLLGRFKNGLLYGFIPGKPCTAEDLTQDRVWRGVARKLGEWHAKVPISGISSCSSVGKTLSRNADGCHCLNQSNGANGAIEKQRTVSSRKPSPNVWSVMQGWISALDTNTEKERARKEMLQQELERCFQELDSSSGIGEHGFVFAHCDLLCANVIQLPSPHAPVASNVQPVTFIDYEYATPAPAAFDISNHFAEWAGYDCDYSMVPSRPIRRGFLQEYIASYSKNANIKLDESAVENLFQDVDRWRGIPGLYWGIWSLIQAKISAIDFDYAKYAEERLGEYFAWRGEADGSRAKQGVNMPLRERRWSED
ncbi:hypothetical protein LTR64_006562 [Lithohypha guttulata]|uniref:ethanolamine kinase n=1 Tax=Lithohypha guttulata TaxID=1690604 RepID=A0AAN7YFE6_9EURO|nr:hypothetical protein LTR51_004880 [Lithohypha guttulata]KAK5091487.1 hypothetical protein LTR05_001671 [Lithohypha guttulata]